MNKRSYWTEDEMTKLLHVARYDKRIRHNDRDYGIFLLGHRHGLRAIEIVNIDIKNIDIYSKHIYIYRYKESNSGNHPLMKDEVAIIKKLSCNMSLQGNLFKSERGSKLTTRAIGFIVSKVCELAGIEGNPHMLRHTCGYMLANKGIDTRTIQDYLGHKNIQNTVRYTALAPERFKTLWER